MNNQIQIISVEGNIGSGKSTLLANLKNHFNNNTNIIFLKEPVDEWSKIKDENGNTILEKFYGDQEKYSFSFQMMAYISRLKLLKDTVKEIQDSIRLCQGSNPPKFIIITERSLFTDKMVFAKMLYDTGKIEHINFQIYLNWFDTFIDEFPVNKIVYVKADPEICHERITTRNRDGENNIPIDYLKSCSEYHDNMMVQIANEDICKCQLVLDGNNNIYKNDDILKKWFSLIENFIHN